MYFLFPQIYEYFLFYWQFLWLRNYAGISHWIICLYYLSSNWILCNAMLALLFPADDVNDTGVCVTFSHQIKILHKHLQTLFSLMYQHVFLKIFFFLLSRLKIIVFLKSYILLFVLICIIKNENIIYVLLCKIE